jgi:uncharacterized membrane protein HdeD (DUF308 family)
MMTDRPTKIWKVVFFLCGLFNVCLGILFISDLKRGMALFTTYQTDEPHTLFVFFLFWFVIAAIGVSLWQVAYNLRSNRAWLGLLSVGKMVICAVLTYGYLSNLASVLALLIGVCDLLWGITIVVFLFQSRELVHERV